MSKLVICEKTECSKEYRIGPGCHIQGPMANFEGGRLADFLVHWSSGGAGGRAATYDDRYKKWRYEDLPILPNPFRYVGVREKGPPSSMFCNR